MFSRDEIDLNQLSFGISGLIQSQLDETKFLQSGDFDPIIDGTVVQKILILMLITSYNFLIFMRMEQSKCIETRRNIYTNIESDNLRNIY
jgi:hypothetical protein